ncbi:sensor histidine kinase [Nannocystis punicea]|uniref:histidine kinase n=1 Tax=Nannocystis punicea TaxID=2995304 RepID=A0ABY7HKF8_9BACT|nr:GAF domain-containing sensor histidine kinase [Nannocystis poenicansa]WAS99515.1 GAF domain-containing sensor histidine kinase [Nannocystis poenicansa]
MMSEEPDTAAGERAPEPPLFVTLTRLLALPVTSVRETLMEACEVLTTVIVTDKIDAFLHDPGSDSLVAVGTNDMPMARQQRAIGLDRLPLANGGRAVEVFRTGKRYICDDVAADREELPGIREVLKVQSAIGVPIEVQGRRRGVLLVVSAAKNMYQWGDLEFLAAVAHWVGVVTHRAELVEEATRAAAERARQRTAEELVSVVAHDLRNLVTPLSARLQVLSARAQAESRAADIAELGKAVRAVERLERVLTCLLSVERIERGLFDPKLQDVDLVELARSTAALFATGGHEIELEAPAQLRVRADPDTLRQGLENLLHNAVSHSPEGAPMSLTIRNERAEGADWTVLRVRDFGPGIPAELRPTLFDRFAAGPQSIGLGLGLYLARSIVQAHGGALTVEDPDGPGACFRLALPLVEPPEANGEDPGGGPHASNGQKDMP